MKFKVFLSFCTWIAFFAHGCTATVAVLTSDTPNYVGPGLLGASRDTPPGRTLGPFHAA